MFKFGVSNLRRLEHVNPIELRPITILVGRNSSGKSTFLRSFPLIRQSLLTRTSTPILWYGELVDFGSYETAVRDNDTANDITFDFGTDFVRRQDFGMSSLEAKDWSAARHYRGVQYRSRLGFSQGKTRIKAIDLDFEIPKLKYHIVVGDDGKVSEVSINGKDCADILEKEYIFISSGTLLPDILYRRPEPTKATESGVFYSHFPGLLINPLEKFVRENSDKRMSDDHVRALVFALCQIGPMEDQLILEMIESAPRSWIKFVTDILVKNKNDSRQDFKRIIALAILPDLIARASSTMKNNMSETLYIGPMRARSERYYRYQDLALSEIDPDGKNFPMFLNSLNGSQLRSLSKWIQGLFGYGIEIGRGSAGSAGHISIQLVDEMGVASNIVDVGYGVSQILPVLAQIWWARARRSPARERQAYAPLGMGERPRVSSPLLAIEQPELHLHPAHQALLADAIVGEARTGADDPVRFLIETHSETFINRLGELVSAGKLDASKIHIIVFSPDDESRVTRVQEATFDENGALNNWPYGFFQANLGQI